MPTRPDVLRGLLEARLATPLDKFIAGHRNVGHSWRTIAAELTRHTGVAVTGETLRQWYRRTEIDEAA